MSKAINNWPRCWYEDECNKTVINKEMTCEKCAKDTSNEDYIYINKQDETLCETCYYDVTESARELANFCHDVLNEIITQA